MAEISLFTMAKRKAESTDFFYSDESDNSESSIQSNLADSNYENSSGDASEDEGEGNDEPIQPFDVPWTESGIPRPPFPHTGIQGAQVPVNIQNLLGIFELFFDDEIINLISEETNR